MKQIDILIIDDEKKFADMLAKRLELRGCRTSICYDGTSALEWLQDHAYLVSLILLDLQLPDLYGIDVLINIKKINPSAPVVVVTGHGTEKDRQACEKIGAHRFIHKPPDIDEVMAILKQVREVSMC